MIFDVESLAAKAKILGRVRGFSYDRETLVLALKDICPEEAVAILNYLDLGDRKILSGGMAEFEDRVIKSGLRSSGSQPSYAPQPEGNEEPPKEVKPREEVIEEGGGKELKGKGSRKEKKATDAQEELNIQEDFRPLKPAKRRRTKTQTQEKRVADDLFTPDSPVENVFGAAMESPGEEDSKESGGDDDVEGLIPEGLNYNAKFQDLVSALFDGGLKTEKEIRDRCFKLKPKFRCLQRLKSIPDRVHMACIAFRIPGPDDA